MCAARPTPNGLVGFAQLGPRLPRESPAPRPRRAVDRVGAAAVEEPPRVGIPLVVVVPGLLLRDSEVLQGELQPNSRRVPRRAGIAAAGQETPETGREL
eukprot:6442164-Pyramimonas_sp.AAC.1